MKTSEFKIIMDNLQADDGRDYFETYLQYMGWFFLNLTAKQSTRLFNHLAKWYHVNESFARDSIGQIEKHKEIRLPNGLVLHLSE